MKFELAGSRKDGLTTSDGGRAMDKREGQHAMALWQPETETGTEPNRVK